MKPYIAGEFQKQKEVWLSWPLYEWATTSLNTDDVAIQIVLNLPKSVDIKIICYDLELKQHALEKLKKAHISLENIELIVYPASIIYPRDFGIAVVKLGNSLAHVHHCFDSYGYYGLEDEESINLNQLPLLQAKELGINERITTDLITEGGDHEFNGDGTMLAIYETEVIKRNPDKTLEEITHSFKEAYGLDNIYFIPQGSYDDEHYLSGPIPDEANEFKAYRSSSANGHIDEICRFINHDTILLAQVSEKEANSSLLHHYNKTRLDEARNVLSKATQTNGELFNIISMPTPEPIYLTVAEEDVAYYQAKPESDTYLDGSPVPEGPIKILPALSYCNFLIVNEVVLSQAYYQPGMSELIKEKDQQALTILKTIFPDRKVIPINTLALNVFGGGIHCMTRNIPDYGI